jgi:hypothetical protein
MKVIKDKKLQKAKRNYDVAVDEYYQSNEEYEMAFSDASCRSCECWKQGREQHLRCKNNFVCDDVVCLYQEKEKVLKQVKIAEAEYAKAIFEVLSPLKVELITRSDEKVVAWSDVFPSNFGDVSIVLRGALVEMVESNGTLYSLKNIKVVV